MSKIINTELSLYVEEIIQGLDDNVIRSLFYEIIEEASGILNFNGDINESTIKHFTKWDGNNEISLEKIQSTIEEFSQLNLKIIPEKQKELEGMQLKFTRDWNKLSIVFMANDNSLLMTGDMKKTVWSNTVKNHCLLPFNVFKAPHHGTKDYFCWDFPLMNECLISNGYRKGWDISALYPLYYNSAFSCTNKTECEFHMGTGSPCPRNNSCGCPSGNIIIINY